MMNLTEEDAKNLDLILELVIKLQIGRNVSTRTVHTQLFIDEHQAAHYLTILADYRPVIVKPLAFNRLRDGMVDVINRSDYTETFLSAGGFKKIYEHQQKELRERQFDSQLQRENWVASTKNAKLSIWLSGIAILISIIALILQFLSKR